MLFCRGLVYDKVGTGGLYESINRGPTQIVILEWIYSKDWVFSMTF